MCLDSVSQVLTMSKDTLNFIYEELHLLSSIKVSEVSMCKFIMQCLIRNKGVISGAAYSR